jgi:hypothetical protein
MDPTLKQEVRTAIGALVSSIESIREADDLDADERSELIEESQNQFKKYVNDLVLTHIRKRGAVEINKIQEAPEPRGRQPKDFSGSFAAGGTGPAHEALWISFDNYRRSMGPARGQAAFAAAWNDLDDDGKQEIRNEEAAAEAARVAAAAAEQKAKELNKMNEIVALAKKIVAGESGNYRSKSEWFRVSKMMAEEQREAGESNEQAFAKFIQTEDGRAMFAAYKGADGPDFQPVPKPVVVAKTDTAYAKLKKLAADLREEQPDLSEYQAFAKIATDPKNRDLLETSKRESA